MGNESSQSKEPEYPKLEPRTNRTVSYGEEPERAAKEHQHAKANTAFYLIEREAIRLRRLRWDQSAEARKACAKIDEEATRAAASASATSRPGARATPQPSDPLAHYAREADRPSHGTDESLISRLQSRVPWPFKKTKE